MGTQSRHHHFHHNHLSWEEGLKGLWQENPHARHPLK